MRAGQVLGGAAGHLEPADLVGPAAVRSAPARTPRQVRQRRLRRAAVSLACRQYAAQSAHTPPPPAAHPSQLQQCRRRWFVILVADSIYPAAQRRHRRLLSLVVILIVDEQLFAASRTAAPVARLFLLGLSAGLAALVRRVAPQHWSLCWRRQSERVFRCATLP